jgi:hypothetical protein
MAPFATSKGKVPSHWAVDTLLCFALDGGRWPDSLPATILQRRAPGTQQIGV